MGKGRSFSRATEGPGGVTSPKNFRAIYNNQRKNNVGGSAGGQYKATQQMMNQTQNPGGNPGTNNFAPLGAIQQAPQGTQNFNTLNNYGGNQTIQSVVPSTAVTQRQNHKRNSNVGGIAKIGRTGMMTPNGMLNEGQGGANKQKMGYPPAHQTIDITDN